MVEPPGQASAFHGPDGPAGGAGLRRDERRNGPDRRQICAPGLDLHGRIEDKRQAIERERRAFGRRSMDGSTSGQ
jgi:hypothetical protein